MKKLYTACLLFICFNAQAQLGLNRTFAPDTIINFSVAETKLNWGSAGQNQNWDFSKVTFVDTAISRSFIPNSTTPGFLNFPTSNYATTGIELLPDGGIIENEGVGFVYHNNSIANILGYYLIADDNKLIGTYNPPMRIYKSPMVINDQFDYIVNLKTTSQDLTDYYHVTKGTGVVKMDGTGKVIFPNKSVAVTATRFKTTETLYDTVVYSTEDYEIKSYINTINLTYEVVDDMSEEALQIDYSKTTETSYVTIGGGAPTMETETTYDTTVTYYRPTTLKELKALATGIDEQQEGLNLLKVYPVPSNGLVSLNFDQIDFVEISDAKGIFIEKQKYNGSIELPASSGLYFIKAVLPDGRYKTLKAVKQ